MDDSSFTDISDSISELVTSHGNLPAYTKAIHSVLCKNSDVGFSVYMNAEAHSPFEFPRGISVTMHKQAPIQIDTMKRVPTTAFVVCALGKTAANGQALDKRYFRTGAQMDALRAAVPQYSPLSASQLGDETEHWEAELGKRGWVGVCTSKERLHGTKKATHFHLAARATAGALDQAYYDWIKAEVGKPDGELPSIGALASHPYTKRVEEVAMRNACRIAYQAARALGVSVETQRDGRSAYAASREFNAPLMAIPTSAQLSNTIVADQLNNTVTIHSNTTPTGGAHDHVMVMFNPHEGFGKFPLNLDARKDTTYPVGMRKNYVDKRVSIEEGAPRHYIPAADAQMHSKFSVSDRYASPDSEAIQRLTNGQGAFTHYKHVTLMTTNSSLERPICA